MAGHDRQECGEHPVLMPSCPALSTQGLAVPAQHRRRGRLTLHRPGSPPFAGAERASESPGSGFEAVLRGLEGNAWHAADLAGTAR